MILDTTFLIDVMNNDAQAANRLREMIRRGEQQHLTSLTVFELFNGVALSSKPEQEKQKVREIIVGQSILPLDAQSAERAGEMHGSLIRTGQAVGSVDAMIAGIALLKNEAVLTRNVKDFSKVHGLRVETY